MEKKVEARDSESKVKPAAKLKRRSLSEVIDASAEGGGYEAGCCSQDCCV